MTTADVPVRAWSAQRIEAFLGLFFGPGNDAWPGMAPGYGKERVQPFAELLRQGGDLPAVLPRFQRAEDVFAFYVIARDAAHAALVGGVIECFAGPAYLTMPGNRMAALDPADPVEAAILDFAGPGTTMRLTTNDGQLHRRRLTEVLLLMQRTMARRPPRLWRASKPLGRLLAEFDAALAAGGEATSAAVLEQLAAQGGITAANFAHLRIKRLDRLGRSSELLELPGLRDVVQQDPPMPVKEAVLNAIFDVAMEEPLSRRDLAGARTGLIGHGGHVPSMLVEPVPAYGAKALTVLLLAAVVRKDEDVLGSITACAVAAGRQATIDNLVWEAAVGLLGAHGGAEDIAPDAEVAQVQPIGGPASVTESSLSPQCWPDLIRAIADGSTEATTALREESWVAWPSPAADDDQIAALLMSLDNSAQAEMWRWVGAFIEAVGYERPAPLTARTLITCALAFDWLGPGDLLAIQALTEIVLRSAPDGSAYADLLGELADTCVRWVAPERASIALDFADRLVMEAHPNVDARETFALALLSPLHAHQRRLDATDLAFARQLSSELLSIDLSWQVEELDSETGVSLSSLSGLSVLLYSLDEAVLARVASELSRTAPGVRVATACDRVGSQQLRQKSRSADVIAVATRCAKHAATGFIAQHAASAVVEYANGSGSASLLRAAVDGLRARASYNP